MLYVYLNILHIIYIVTKLKITNEKKNTFL